jgi:hypothetical protein
MDLIRRPPAATTRRAWQRRAVTPFPLKIDLTPVPVATVEFTISWLRQEKKEGLAAGNSFFGDGLLSR